MATPKAKTLQQKLGFFDDDLKNPTHDEILIWLDKNINEVVDQVFNLSSWNKNHVEKKIQEANTLSAQNIRKIESEIENNLLKIEEYQIEMDTSSQHDTSLTARSIESLKKENSELLNVLKELKLFNGLSHDDLPEKQKPIYETYWESPVTQISSNYKTGYTNKNIIGYIDLLVKITASDLNVVDSEINKKITTPKFVQTMNVAKPDLLIEVKTKINSVGELLRQINTYREYKTGVFLVVCPDDKFADILKKEGIYFYKYVNKNC